MLTKIQLSILALGFSVVTFAQSDDLIESTNATMQSVVEKNTLPGDSLKSTDPIEDGKYLEQVSIVANKSLSQQVVNVDWKTSPARSSQNLLQTVPGLFVAQHAGGGKAEQIFLRGFDVDHGTDVAISVDGVPVNQVSHAHGQGYTDLHFVMPQLIDNITFNKGPYNPRYGNFATAGSVQFNLKEQLTKNQLSLGYGMYNSKEVFGAIKLLDQKKHDIYLAGSFNSTDGYFVADQNFYRYNAHLAYTGRIAPRTKLKFTATSFRSQWDASGQIPLRAIRENQITRFGAIDSTEGGNTGRTTANLSLTHFFTPNSSIKANAYHVLADFELYSNFTFFLRDSINGDQIRQRENRITSGFNLEYRKKFGGDKFRFDWTSGVGLRHDQVNGLELAYTKNRTETLQYVQLGDVDETNYFGFSNLKTTLGKWTLNAGLRGELINHQYSNKLEAENRSNQVTLPGLLPSTSLFYKWNDNFQLFAKWGVGYHSNDSRFVLDQTVTDNLPLAISNDVGFEWKPINKMVVNVALWRMTSEQEFIYVGDEGVVEASGASIRKGIDLYVALQPCRSILINTSINYSHARAVEDQSYLPLAAPLTSTASIHFTTKKGFNASWRARYMADRPANEDNTIQAEGYFVNDLVLGWGKGAFDVKCSILNVFNTRWNETQFLTESRLKNETESVEEIHFTPGTPFNANLTVSYTF